MSVQPGQHNITVQRRADYDLQLQFKDSAGVGIDLTASWMVELDDGDEISLMIANHSNTTDIVLKRGRIVASEVFA